MRWKTQGLFLLSLALLTIAGYQTAQENITGMVPHSRYPDHYSESSDVTINQQALRVTDTAVYQQAYYSLAGSNQWTPITLNGNAYQTKSDWLAGKATYTLPAGILDAGEHYVITYSCTLATNAWDCHGGKWQLHVICNHCTQDCAQNAFRACHQGDLYWYNSCGLLEKPAEACEHGCHVDECTTAPTDITESLLANGFENGGDLVLPFIQGANTGTITADTTRAHSGTYSLRIDSAEKNGYTTPGNGADAPVLSITQGPVTVKLSAMAYTIGGTGGYLSLFCLGNDYRWWDHGFTQEYSSEAFTTSANEWSEQTVTLTCDSSAKYVSVRLAGTSGTSIWYDDPRVEIIRGEATFSEPDPCDGCNEPRIIGVVASSQCCHENAPENTLDGIVDSSISAWSAEGDGEWITYELSEAATIEYVQFSFYGDSQRNFDLQASLDGNTWNTLLRNVWSAAGSEDRWQRFTFSPAYAKYVRFVGRGSSSSAWNAIGEADINGFVAAIEIPDSPTCSDGVQNQGELGIDCGGPCPKTCATPPPGDCAYTPRYGSYENIHVGRPRNHFLYDEVTTNPNYKVLFSIDFEERPLGRWETYAEFKDSWNKATWQNRGEEAEVVCDPVDQDNKAMLVTFPFWDPSIEENWVCWGEGCSDSEGRRIYFHSREEMPVDSSKVLMNNAEAWSGGFSIDIPLGRNYDEVYLSYNIKYEPDWSVRGGGKLPGFRKTGPGCPACAPTDCMDEQGNRYEYEWDSGNKAWIYYDTNGNVIQPDGIADDFGAKSSYTADHVSQYVYYYNNPNRCGSSGSVSESMIFDGDWHNIVLRARMNDIGSANGVVETYIDGVRRGGKSGIIFRTPGSTFGISSINFGHYLGGFEPCGEDPYPQRVAWSCEHGEWWKDPSDRWIQACAVDINDPCKGWWTFADGSTQSLRGNRKTEYVHFDDIVAYTLVGYDEEVPWN